MALYLTILISLATITTITSSSFHAIPRLHVIATCGGFPNCISYTNGCGSCFCGADGKQIARCSGCAAPPPHTIFPDPHCTVCIDGYKLNPATYECESISITTIRSPPNLNLPCGGFHYGCNSYSNGCDSCWCGIDGTDIPLCSGCAPPQPGMVFPPPRCLGCIDGYILNPTTNQCEPCPLPLCQDPCGPYNAGAFNCAEGADVICRGSVDCTGCYAKYYLNDIETTCTQTPITPSPTQWCLLPPCVNPCGPFEWRGTMNGERPYCEGYPNTRCQGYAECNKGCYAKYFDEISGKEIVDCKLVHYW